MSKQLVASLIVCLLLISFGLIASANAAIPKSDNILIHIFTNPDTENMALDTGEIDINDWPLAKEWVDKWSVDPAIAMRYYTEMGMMEFDIYNARWPTGCPYHHMDDEYFATCARCRAAREFRKALAYLTNKEKYTRVFMKGYGIRLDFPLPPFLSQYLPEEGTWTKYLYNPTLANLTLFNAGFHDWDGDGMMEWKKPVGYPTDPGGNTGQIEEITPLKFWVRMDDPNRRAAGEDLGVELTNLGIPLDLKVTERSTCYKNVMVIYDYNIYTGGWSLGTIPDVWYDLYSSYTYYYPVGWSLNYPGWCNSTEDTWATAVKYPATITDAIIASQKCGVLASRSVPTIWLWCSASMKGYRTGWSGVVNVNGYGVDNGYSFARMTGAVGTTPLTIDWGFKSDVEQLNRVSSEWLWDDNVLDRIYDGMVDSNPFTLKTEFPALAESWTITTWNPTPSTTATEIVFKIRSGVKWHNATGEPRNQILTAYDLEFSIDFAKITGAGVCFYKTLTDDLNSTWVDPLDTTMLHCRMNHQTVWGLDWMAGCPALNPHLWNKLPDAEGDTCDWVPGAALVYNHAWNRYTARDYDPVTEDVDNDGVVDIKEDGVGAWMYDSSTATSINLIKDPQYYQDEATYNAILKGMFHYGYGDADDSERVESVDIGGIIRCLGTSGDKTLPPYWPPTWGVYDPACDLNTGALKERDGNVDGSDLTVCLQNYAAIVG